MKKYYFLSGLPRSGNTLLGSLLNQNKNISVTANSPVAEIFYRIESVKHEMLSPKNFPNDKSFSNVNRNILQNYYSDWESKYIIDRSCWGTPDNLNILKTYCPNEIKIIVLLRDISEVLASFIKWSLENPGNFLDSYQTIEEKCDFLMHPNGQIMKHLHSSYNLSLKENRKYALFIQYNDLTENTKSVVEEIYDFLCIKKYDHQYKNLSQFKVNNTEYCDEIYGRNLHYIKPNLIEKSNYKVLDYINDTVINKYKDYQIRL